MYSTSVLRVKWIKGKGTYLGHTPQPSIHGTYLVHTWYIPGAHTTAFHTWYIHGTYLGHTPQPSIHGTYMVHTWGTHHSLPYMPHSHTWGSGNTSRSSHFLFSLHRTTTEVTTPMAWESIPKKDKSILCDRAGYLPVV